MKSKPSSQTKNSQEFKKIKQNSHPAKSQLQALFNLDIIRVRNWFRTNRATKIIVFLGFIFVLLIIVAIELFLGFAFFGFLSTQEEFGLAVAQYSLNASFLLLFLLSVVSSIAASSKMLFKPNFLTFLISSPLPSAKLFLSRSLTALVSSTSLLIILLTPMLITFGYHFQAGIDFLLRSLLVVILLAISSHSLGIITTLLLVKLLGGISRKLLGLIFFLVISGSLLLMRILFPPAFFRLYYAENWLSFQEQLGSLPLWSSLLPTNWLAQTLTSYWSLATLLAVAASLAISLTAYYLGKKYYLLAWRSSHTGMFLASSSTPVPFKKSSFTKLAKSRSGALLANEFLALFRSPAELSYLALLAGFSIILLFLMRNIPNLEKAQPAFLPAVQALSLAGFVYLFMTLAARLSYPLMAKEKKTSWLLFSLPLKKEEILKSKMGFSILIAVPFLLIGFIGSLLAGFSFPKLVYFMLLFSIVSFSISLVQLFLGAISPNFYEADNLEAASTSGSGLAAILISLTLNLSSAFFFYLFLIQKLSGLLAVLLTFLLSVSILIPLWSKARMKIYHYNL